MALIIYFRFPLGQGTIDPLLMAVDAHLGYVWSAGVEALAVAPWAGLILAWVYKSALLQLLIVMAVLAYLRRDADLHRFMLAGTVALLFTTAVWWIMPSIGPAMFQAIPASLEAGAHLVVNEAYSGELRRLAVEGDTVLSSRAVLGVIAFPSFHMVMACLAVWFSRGTFLFPVAVAANLPMIPATMFQGGHHAVDLIGGAAVVLLSLLCLRAIPSRIWV
jgi:hypothetical protein